MDWANREDRIKKLREILQKGFSSISKESGGEAVEVTDDLVEELHDRTEKAIKEVCAEIPKNAHP